MFSMFALLISILILNRCWEHGKPEPLFLTTGVQGRMLFPPRGRTPSYFLLPFFYYVSYHFITRSFSPTAFSYSFYYNIFISFFILFFILMFYFTIIVLWTTFYCIIPVSHTLCCFCYYCLGYPIFFFDIHSHFIIE